MALRHYPMPLISFTFVYLAFVLFAWAAPIEQWSSTVSYSATYTISTPIETVSSDSIRASSTFESYSPSSETSASTSIASVSTTSTVVYSTTLSEPEITRTSTHWHKTTVSTTSSDEYSTFSAARVKPSSASIAKAKDNITRTSSPYPHYSVYDTSSEASADQTGGQPITSTETTTMIITTPTPSSTLGIITTTTSASHTTSSPNIQPAFVNAPAASSALPSSIAPIVNAQADPTPDADPLESNTETIFEMPGTKLEVSGYGMAIVGILLGICVVVIGLGVLDKARSKKDFRRRRGPSISPRPTSNGWYRIETRE
ncbi:hypothetical protein FRC02_000704 [Tulasnella sp. 418]|nr:hypothetical protein FRC02_000704 [Tulasnella sp. 418]